MIKNIVSIATSVMLYFITKAQQPIFTETFEHLTGIETVTGILGKALNLGPDASVRQVVQIQYSSENQKNEFSVTVWVKADLNASEPYDILSALDKKDELFDGWKIGATANGGWEFKVLQKSKIIYDYTATAPRQTIRNGSWHLLTITYNGKELRLYYDGNIIAIYRADDFTGFYASKKLIIGGSIDSEHFFKKSGWKTYWDSFNGEIDDITNYAEALQAEKIAAYYQQAAGRKPLPSAVDYMPDIFTLTAFNIFHGAHEFGKETGKKHLTDMLRNMNSDAYLLVETYGSGAEIADALGYYFYLISTNLSIISRYPFTKTYNLSSPFNGGAAEVQLSNGKKINLVCLWLNYLPARNIGEKGWVKEKFMEEENKTRGADIKKILADISSLLKANDSIPVIVAGDFNSGSHLDWVEQTKPAHKGQTISWPASIAMKKAGFKDSFREIYPDPLKTPGTTFYNQDRIDYIYYQGKSIHAIDAEIIGTHPVVFPSDHSAVSTMFKLDN
jgi:endonuclease/exonuclease/phosphatase family metal-dependent hydrolase